jgi:hypothetical protein
MARIHSLLTVTKGGLLYLNIAEIVSWVDFHECLENHTFFMPHASHNDAAYRRCIARCSLHNPIMPYIEFFTVPLIRLEFENPDELRDLLRQIYRFGWRVYDMDDASTDEHDVSSV